MTEKKVAIIADTAIDIPLSFAKEKGIFLVPISVIFSDGEFRDQVDITSDEVYERLEQEIPSTSLPSGECIAKTFDKVAAAGYKQAIIFTMSSAMSGTYNLFKLMAADEDRFESFVFDTKNIGLGGGFFAMHAASLAEEGVGFAEIIAKVCNTVKKSKQFGKFSSFEYLQKGGRIGLVTAKIGSILNIKPIISVNEDGIIYTAAKVKGDKKAHKEMVKLLKQYLNGKTKFCLSVLNGKAEAEAKEMVTLLREAFPEQLIVEQKIGTAFGVHTGPGMLVVGAYIYE